MAVPSCVLYQLALQKRRKMKEEEEEAKEGEEEEKRRGRRGKRRKRRGGTGERGEGERRRREPPIATSRKLPIPWCKYSYHGQFQATSVRSLKAKWQEMCTTGSHEPLQAGTCTPLDVLFHRPTDVAEELQLFHILVNIRYFQSF